MVCSPKTTPGFSAVAYFLAKDLRGSVGHPIGLIEAAWSGSCAQAWVDQASLAADPMFSHYLDDYKKAVAAYPGGQSELDARAADDQARLTKSYVDYHAALGAWQTAVTKATASGQPAPPKPARASSLRAACQPPRERPRCSLMA